MHTVARTTASSILVFAFALTGLALAFSRIASGGASEWSERGVALGMTEAQVRLSFRDAAAGAWTDAPSCRGPALEWTRTQPGPGTRWARFELHDGWLVAMRLHTDAPSGPPHAAQTWSAVRQDRPFEGGTATTVVARGCPTHAAEADEIAIESLTGLLP